jgi:hypothetical protein
VDIREKRLRDFTAYDQQSTMLESLSNCFPEARSEFLQINRFHRYLSSLRQSPYHSNGPNYSSYPT